MHIYSMTEFQILLHATELKLLYTAEVKDSLSDTRQLCSKYIQTWFSSSLATKNLFKYATFVPIFDTDRQRCIS